MLDVFKNALDYLKFNDSDDDYDDYVEDYDDDEELKERTIFKPKQKEVSKFEEREKKIILLIRRSI